LVLSRDVASTKATRTSTSTQVTSTSTLKWCSSTSTSTKYYISGLELISKRLTMMGRKLLYNLFLQVRLKV